jgi:hypothetical protein
VQDKPQGHFFAAQLPELAWPVFSSLSLTWLSFSLHKAKLWTHGDFILGFFRKLIYASYDLIEYS